MARDTKHTNANQRKQQYLKQSNYSLGPSLLHRLRRSMVGKGLYEWIRSHSIVVLKIKKSVKNKRGKRNNGLFRQGKRNIQVLGIFFLAFSFLPSFAVSREEESIWFS